jgi:DNA replication licensing factor MCM2
MCAANKSSLEVSYIHLGEQHALLAIWLTDLPKEMLQIFDEVLYKDVVLVEFPHYSQITLEVHVRITCLPIADKLRDLRQGDLNNLIRVTGVVTRRTGVFPQLKAVAYDCSKCGQTVGPFQVTGIEIKPNNCVSCGELNTFVQNSAKTIYGNYQRMTLQETPGSVPAGRVPRYKDVILLGDLIDIARPGEEIEVTGIYMHSQRGESADKSGFPVFGTVIEANCILKVPNYPYSNIYVYEYRYINIYLLVFVFVYLYI